MTWLRTYRPGSMWREMDRLQREMNRLFADFPKQWTAPVRGYPAMNVWTNEEGAVVTSELPGCSPENIDISVVGDTLTITGAVEPEELPEEAQYHRRERSCGTFTRSFRLPFAIDPTKVDAIFNNGVLHIELPRAEEDKPRKIKVKNA
ncbi:MAG: Hsp20/alpha crystallin family protein [Anaerolineae bacterium]|nr:Hsp20/alpha crystallin family protein [Anaerolineae bacterium]